MHNATIGFSLTVPDGFTQTVAGRSSSLTWTIAFQSRRKTSGIPDATVVVQRLGGVIEPGPVDLAAVRKGWRATEGKGRLLDLRAFPAHWAGFTIGAVRFKADSPAGPTVSWAAWVPLRREAVLVVVEGPLSRDAQLSALLTRLLQSLHGETNRWNGANGWYRLGEALGVIVLVLFVPEVLRAPARKRRARQMKSLAASSPRGILHSTTDKRNNNR